MTTPAPAGLLATPLSSRQTRFTLPPPPPPLTPGRPGLDRVLDLVTEHETHYRHQARAALQRACGCAPLRCADASCVRTSRASRQELRMAELAKRLADCEAQLDPRCAAALRLPGAASTLVRRSVLTLTLK